MQAAARKGLGLGEAAPWFVGETRGNPRYHFSSVAGRYVLMGFPPGAGAGAAQADAPFLARRAVFDDLRLTCFLVARDRASVEQARDHIPGLRWFLDPRDEIADLYGERDEAGRWLLLDPTLRVMATFAWGDPDGLLAGLDALPPPDLHSGLETPAPVLLVPRVFEPELCRRLIELYEARGGERSGVMREEGGRTIGVLVGDKSRRDAMVDDPALQRELRARIGRRLVPEVRRAFQFQATRIERYIVACYDAAEGGFFRAHRDNTTPATAHRRFAVTINLNAGEYEGGDLRFPEFGQRTYRAPTGGAVVFSCALLHEATPVAQGRRYAFLPFLFDEAAEAVRQANAGSLGPSAAAGPAGD